MSITEIILIVIAVLVLLCLGISVFVVVRLRDLNPRSASELAAKIVGFDESLSRFDRLLRDEFGRGREETAALSKLLREEISTSIGTLSTSVTNSVSALAQTQEVLLGGFGDRLTEMKTEAATRAIAFREEVQTTFRNISDTISNAVANLSTSQAERLDAVTKQIAALTEGNERHQENVRTGMEARLIELKTEAGLNAKALREEVAASLKALGDALTKGVEQLTEMQKERLQHFSVAIDGLTKQTVEQHEALRVGVEARLDAVRADNTEKLEQMRLTVDEKLQSTLDQRLGASFKLVSEQLEQVFRSVGEMQTLAAGVGDLKKVLSNVKMRGAWGEVALGNLLEQIMTSEQFERNVEIKPGSGQRVEYAIKLPGGDKSEGPLWIPIDAKFPTEDYDRLVQASDQGDADAIEAASRSLELRIRGAAKDICAKYIHAPYSTDFAVLFLPTEGLFAEVIRRPGLVESLQTECRIIVTGPTTLMALLNSLRMGFRTLAIQKRSSEVWQLLAAVKTEFGKYGQLLDKVQKKLQEASNTIENVTVRRKAIDRKLRAVEVLPEMQAASILNLTNAAEISSEIVVPDDGDDVEAPAPGNEENGPIESRGQLE
jgi:DNA recombination protein RmuC